MRILFDTNILLDILLKREEFYKLSYLSINKAINNGDNIYISPTSLNDVNYIYTKLKKQNKNDESKRIILKLLTIFNVAKIDEATIYDAYISFSNDFEDSIIESCAIHNFCETIITRNKKDFSYSNLNILTPEEFLHK